MTYIARSEIRCRLCGSLSRHRVLLSSNTFVGTDDLDGRPPGMLRRTMNLWVQRCPECGYCATDLSDDVADAMPVSRVLGYDDVSVTLEAPVTAPPSDWSNRRRDLLRSVLTSKVYQGQLHDLSFPKLRTPSCVSRYLLRPKSGTLTRHSEHCTPPGFAMTRRDSNGPITVELGSST